MFLHVVFKSQANELVLFQGGSTSGEVSLTAYVLISLLEARSVEGVSSVTIFRKLLLVIRH